MFINKEKAELIIEIYGSQKDATCQKIVKLLNILIDETRTDNDTAEGREILQNQGKIKAYIGLKEMIERGLPSSPKA